jgi:hypothetical protein
MYKTPLNPPFNKGGMSEMNFGKGGYGVREIIEPP